MTNKTFQLAKPLHCGACALKIEGTLRKIEGIVNYDISFSEARFQVAFDESAVSAETIQEKIQELGYDVESIN